MHFKEKIKQLRIKLVKIKNRFATFIKRLLFPLYLFPLKLFTYSLFYLIKLLIKLLFAFIGLIFDCIIFPFKSFKNFLKAIFLVIVFIYLLLSLFVIGDYINTHYGWYGKFFCSFGTSDRLKNSVVRIVGGNSEGSGFFIEENIVITNFHVIADEPSPKIIFPNGKFITPTKIAGDEELDLAVLFTKDNFPDFVFYLPDRISLEEFEPVLAAGYPMGTNLTGTATILKGNFINFRKSKQMPIAYTQTDIDLVKGMSGGPLVDQCGQVIGVNTIGLSGLSLFINADWVKKEYTNFTDREVSKLNVNPALSPEEAVKAYYSYLKARRMEDGFNLLSEEYLQKTNFEEWTNRFADILDVDIISIKKEGNTKDTVFVKFSTKNWVEEEVEYRYYEGTWQTIFEDGIYKMLKSKIKEVVDPEINWYFE